MIAREIARRLGHARRVGRNFRCDCPVHHGNSLTLRDGKNGGLLATCWGGCEWRTVFRELRRLGLIEGRPAEISAEEERERGRRREVAERAEIERLRRRIAAARDLYRHSKDAAGTLVETYLRSRGITGPIPPALRYLPSCPHRNGTYSAAMVAPVVTVTGEQIAIHKTFLRPDGRGKADLPKEYQRETWGPMKGGAVRLDEPRPDRPLLVGEGLESTLSAMQMFGLPGWAALCASGIEALELPAEIMSIVIAADNDENLVGQRKALSARERWQDERRQVRIITPPLVGQDFNDLFCSQGI